VFKYIDLYGVVLASQSDNPGGLVLEAEQTPGNTFI